MIMVWWHLRGYWSKKFSDDQSASSVLFVSFTWTKRDTVCVLSVWNGNPFGQKLYEASSICKGYSGKKISDDQSASFVLLVSFTGTKRDIVFVLSVWNVNPFDQKLYVTVLDLDLFPLTCIVTITYGLIWEVQKKAERACLCTSYKADF